jgi:8-oxo-dGTP pyrophosphatase MutT (NUDIX family)
VSPDRIFEILHSRSPQTLSEEHLKPAAVLVPIQERKDGNYLLLTRRGATLSSHRGEIAFPGGVVDPSDSGPLETALRESHEEVGLEPQHVRVLGQLDQVTTSSIYLVTPFVGLIPFPYEFRLNQTETKAVFFVPISALLDPKCFHMETNFSTGRQRPIYHFRYETWDIWGATARIIKQLLELVYGFIA